MRSRKHLKLLEGLAGEREQWKKATALLARRLPQDPLETVQRVCNDRELVLLTCGFSRKTQSTKHKNKTHKTQYTKHVDIITIYPQHNMNMRSSFDGR